MFKSLDKFNLINPTFLGILTGLVLALTVLSRDLFFIILLMIFMFAYLTFTGNIFCLNSTINLKKVGGSLIVFIIIFLIEKFLNLQNLMGVLNVGIISLLSVSLVIRVLLIGTIGKSIGLIFNNLKDIGKSIKKYLFKFRVASTIGIIMEIVLLISIWKVNSSSGLVYFMVFFWGVSGLIYVLVLFTDFILEEKTETIISILKIYGITRLTYFLIPLFIVQSQLHWIIFYFIFILVYIGMIWGLQPYLFGSSELKSALKVLKLMGGNKELKVIKISQNIGLSKERTLALLSKLRIKRMVKKNPNNRWELGELYSMVTKL